MCYVRPYIDYSSVAAVEVLAMSNGGVGSHGHDEPIDSAAVLMCECVPVFEMLTLVVAFLSL